MGHFFRVAPSEVSILRGDGIQQPVTAGISQEAPGKHESAEVSRSAGEKQGLRSELIRRKRETMQQEVASLRLVAVARRGTLRYATTFAGQSDNGSKIIII